MRFLHYDNTSIRLRTLLPVVAIVIFILNVFVSCANIGTPDGGRYDEEPPVVVSTKPMDGGVNTRSRKINIRFNEYIKLENASEKVIVSPPQVEPPNVRADGKSVKVTLYDSLRSNTTYTIDFSDAIQDNNEGNPMGHYTFSFSTGKEIDSLEISGNVLNAADLEPIKGILVGVHPYDSLWNDSIFRTKPFLRVSRTNGAGRFSIKGIKQGIYRLFALMDADGGFTFSQKSEIIAFDTVTVNPYCAPDVKSDTLWRDSTHIDTVISTPYTHFYPDNVVLKAFLEEGQDLHLLKTEYKTPEMFTIYFTTHVDTLPVVRGLNFDEKALCAIPTAFGDTIQYWVKDTVLFHHQDTLSFEYKYLDTDTTGVQVWKTDTLELVPRTTWAKIYKDMQKKVADWEKAQQKEKKRKSKKGTKSGGTNSKQRRPDEEVLGIKSSISGGMGPHQNVRITFSQPLEHLDSTALHFYIKKDTLWNDAPFLFEPDPVDPRLFTLYAEWEPEQSYRFEIDSMATHSILGLTNDPYKQEINIQSLDAFGTLFVNLIAPDTSFVVQLLTKDDKPAYTVRVNSKKMAEFYYLKPGEYYMRCFHDINANGKWDTGNYDQGVQPEEVYYFPKPMVVRAMWDTEQDWDINGIPVLKQKAEAITKQKPDKVKILGMKNLMRNQSKK